MKYGLTRDVINSSSFIPLSEDEFNTLVAGVNNLQLLLAIEEQFDLLISNYLELENDLLAMATRWMVAMRPEWGYMAIERNLIVNRRLINLLNACRGYLDHTKHHLNSIYPPDVLSYFEEFKRYVSEEYDAHFGFRVMEAMRNYAQHAGFPISVTYDARWVGEGDDRLLRVVPRPYLDVLRLGKSFKPRRVQAELENAGKKIQIMPFVRQYVASLGNTHHRTFSLLRPSIDKWDTAVLGRIERFEKEHHGEKSLGLMAVSVAKDGVQERGAWVFPNAIEHRRELEMKRRDLGTLARRYVSSESR